MGATDLEYGGNFPELQRAQSSVLPQCDVEGEERDAHHQRDNQPLYQKWPCAKYVKNLFHYELIILMLKIRCNLLKSEISSHNEKHQ